MFQIQQLMHIRLQLDGQHLLPSSNHSLKSQVNKKKIIKEIFIDMIQDKNNPKHWTADEGKVFKRINHEDIMGQDLWLGYSYYIDGKKLDEKHLDVIEEFEEIDMPEDMKKMLNGEI